MTTLETRIPSAQDRRFLEKFQRGLFAKGEFRHRDHLHLAWIYLRLYPLTVTLENLGRELKKFARQNGAPEKYHETITWTYVLLINMRMTSGPSCACFEEFARLNSDLLTSGRSLIEGYYRPETLQSDLARRVFLLPDVGTPEESAPAP